MITPGIYVMLYYCLAMLVDGDWIMIHMEVMRVLSLGYLKVATLIHIWEDWLGHLGNPVLSMKRNLGVSV